MHWSAVGPGDTADITLMEWAAAQDYVVLTADLDFGAILAATQSSGPSVVQVRSGTLSPTAIGRSVLSAVRQAEKELLDGALVSVDPARARLRVLPLKDR